MAVDDAAKSLPGQPALKRSPSQARVPIDSYHRWLPKETIVECVGSERQNHTSEGNLCPLHLETHASCSLEGQNEK